MFFHSEVFLTLLPGQLALHFDNKQSYNSRFHTALTDHYGSYNAHSLHLVSIFAGSTTGVYVYYLLYSLDGDLRHVVGNGMLLYV